tara:strand:- start:30 stop:665 length:636 start_codon:yes stop_codon:yes gene_type:complete
MVEYLAGNRIIGTKSELEASTTNILDGSIFATTDENLEYVFNSSESRWYGVSHDGLYPPLPVTVGASTNALVMNANPYWGKANRFTTGHVIIGKTVTSVDVDLIKIGSPTGTLVVGKYNTSGNLVTTFGSLSSSTISTSKTTYTFNTSTDTVANNEYIGVRLDTGRDSSNYISVYGSSSNVTPNAGLYTYNGSWLDDTSTDLYMVITWTEL